MDSGNLVLTESIRKRLSHVHWSFNLLNISLSELYILTAVAYTDNELKILGGRPFNIYKLTLHYTAVMEYCKLLEKSGRNRNKKLSSLSVLNDVLLREYCHQSDSIFHENERILVTLFSSEIHEQIRIFRDKKLGHSDDHEVNLAFEFKSFTIDDLTAFFTHLKKIAKVLNNIASAFGVQYDVKIPHRENQTKHFIQNQAEYRKYFFDNFLDATSRRRRSGEPM